VSVAHPAAGTVAPGFEGVREAFERNLAERGDGGCAFAAVVDGRPVVDLWGGIADERDGAPWTEATAAVVFSGSKGIVAALALVLCARGVLDLDARVETLWPDFAAGGKASITVAQLLSHAAGLPAVEQPLERADLGDPQRIAALLAAQRPMVQVGVPCYHAVTFGWLAGELIRRADGRSVGRLLAAELAGPHGLELTFGTAARRPDAAPIAHLRPSPDFQLSAFRAADPDPRLRLVYANPPHSIDAWNDPDLLAIEVPAVNAVVTARSMAAMYGLLVARRHPLVDAGTLGRGMSKASAGDDPLSGRPLRFGPTGFELAGTPSELGPAPDAFGHTGSGGSSHGAWPTLVTGFSYVTADLRPEAADGRAGELLNALHEAVA
jgi:CubicO group peptidase (beta-lactamase class C family)